MPNKLAPLTKGQIVYVRLQSNAARGKPDDKLIEEWEVRSVGRKYITAAPVGKPDSCGTKFNRWDSKEFPLRQVSDYTPIYKIYYDKQQILDEMERKEITSFIRDTVFRGLSTPDLSLKQLRAIKEIIDCGPNYGM